MAAVRRRVIWSACGVVFCSNALARRDKLGHEHRAERDRRASHRPCGGRGACRGIRSDGGRGGAGPGGAGERRGDIAALRLEIEKLRRALYGTRSERKARLLEQLELQLEELEATATEDDLAAEALEAPVATAPTRERRRPARKPFPAHLPRERVIVRRRPAARPAARAGSSSWRGRHRDAGSIPRRWKVIQTVREKFTCRDCERISQPPAPFHPTPRGWAGPSLLATILFEKFGQHQPLNRQAERYAREGVDLSLSTLADQVGACAAALAPLHDRIAAHVLGAERLHGDDTPVPVLAKGRTETGRLWVYVRDDRPFAGGAPPAALYRYSRDRRGEHPATHLSGWSGILQADACAGFGSLYAPDRSPGSVTEALCWAHARRKFFELADIAASARRGSQAPPISPLAREAVTRIDAVFDAERAVNGLDAARVSRSDGEQVAPLGCRPRDLDAPGAGQALGHAPVDLSPGIRAIASWNLPPLDRRGGRPNEAQAFQ